MIEIMRKEIIIGDNFSKYYQILAGDKELDWKDYVTTASDEEEDQGRRRKKRMWIYFWNSFFGSLREETRERQILVI